MNDPWDKVDDLEIGCVTIGLILTIVAMIIKAIA